MNAGLLLVFLCCDADTGLLIYQKVSKSISSTTAASSHQPQPLTSPVLTDCLLERDMERLLGEWGERASEKDRAREEGKEAIQ